MSPASSGALEVERYIGACLISSQSRAKRYEYFLPHHHHQQKYHQNHHLGPVGNNNGGSPPFRRCHSVDGWAGGVPLISFANHQRKAKKQQPAEDANNHDGLTRLAVHTQGAPLILAQKYNNNSNGRRGNNPRKTPLPGNGNGCSSVDAISVTSDESTGTANAEQTLPRIIKPRKRRKKDRKPHLLQPFNHDDGLSTDSASPETDLGKNSFFPVAYNQYNGYANNNNNVNHHYHWRKYSDHGPATLFPKDEISETPKLHHRFEDVQDLKEDDPKETTSCQCTYCNPADQIWDVSKNRYSPFLTAPKGYGASSQLPKLVEAVSMISIESGGKGKKQPPGSSVPGTARNLEISTEIVTSLNGHRDLEIKLFPSSFSSTEVNNNVVVHGGKKPAGDDCDRGYSCFKSIMYRSLSLEE